ncbi:MAG TPA: TlpA disulfide reductase family protein, partial [Chloroflexota bacterium]
MPGWQHYYTTRRPGDLELLSVAVDMGGEDAVRIWTERAGLTFPTLLDPDNRLGALFGFKAIPNGILIDREGVIRYTKFG